MILPAFEKIYIDPDSESSEVAARVRSLYPADLIKSASSEDEILSRKGPLSAEEFNTSKKHSG